MLVSQYSQRIHWKSIPHFITSTHYQNFVLYIYCDGFVRTHRNKYVFPVKFESCCLLLRKLKWCFLEFSTLKRHKDIVLVVLVLRKRWKHTENFSIICRTNLMKQHRIINPARHLARSSKQTQSFTKFFSTNCSSKNLK